MESASAMPGLSILIPHLSSPLSDMSLYLCFQMFRENTTNKNHELIVVQGFTNPYNFWNVYSDRAQHEHIVFFNNDMLPAPGWDTEMQAHVDDNSLVMGYLVEPGVVPVARQNIEKDFGRSPFSFKRKDFESFCATYEAPEVKEELGWYMPVMMTRTFFARMGKYPTEPPFPHPNDIAFWDHCKGKGAKLVRVRSLAYHFQNLSNPAHDSKRLDRSGDDRKEELSPTVNH